MIQKNDVPSFFVVSSFEYSLWRHQHLNEEVQWQWQQWNDSGNGSNGNGSNGNGGNVSNDGNVSNGNGSGNGGTHPNPVPCVWVEPLASYHRHRHWIGQ